MKAGSDVIIVFMQRYKKALVIGRFQPFHNGHLFLIKKSLEIANSIVLAIGSAQKNDEKNPFGLEIRKKMLEMVVEREGLEGKVLGIVPLYDNPSDDLWFEDLKKKVFDFDATIGNNPWNNGIIEKRGIAAVTIGLYNREELEAAKIRSLMQENKAWEDRVPEYLVELIKKNNPYKK